MVESRPAAAYTIAMVGVAFQAVAVFFLVSMLALFPPSTNSFPSYGPWMMIGWMTGYPHANSPAWILVLIILALIVVGLGVYGVIVMHSPDVVRVRMGSTLLLIASIIAFSTMWGFLIGSLLMFVGSMLGYAWLPPPTQTPQ